MTRDPERSRRLAWEGCLNARELGGYATASGRETRWGAAIRADNLAPLSSAGRDALVAYGVRTIVDLRLPGELEEHPNPFAQPGAHGIAYHNISLVDPAAEPGPAFTTLADDYKQLLDRFSPAVGAIMTEIARAPDGGVLIHCMAGRDRTGLISALLLELVGVPRATIGADYALSSECLRPVTDEWLENGPGERSDREQEVETFLTRPEVILEVLKYLDERYGGAEGYLLAGRAETGDLDRLRRRLLADAG